MRQLLILLNLFFATQHLYAQGFMIGPYQDFSIASPIVADFTGDGHPDVMGIQFGSPDRIVLRNNNGGSPISFGTKELNLNFETAGQPAAADMDGDQDIDLIITKNPGLHLFLMRNDGQANFTLDSLGVSGSSALKISDADNDSDLDIVGFDYDTHVIRLYTNDGNLNFTAQTLLTGATTLEQFDIGDLDNDNQLDIVLGYYDFTGKQVSMLKKIANGSYQEATLAINQFSSISDLVVEDINNDGRRDIMVLRSGGCSALRNDGNLQFTRVDLASPSGIKRDLLVGDYDGDGRKDFVIGTNSSGISWHRNLSNSTLEFDTRTVGTVSPVFSMVNSDLDGDDDLDIVVTNGQFWWYENVIPQLVSTLQFPHGDLKVYPNPFKDILFFSNTGSETWRTELFDLQGRQAFTSELSGNSINLPALPSGEYVLRITHQNSGLSKSIILLISPN